MNSISIFIFLFLRIATILFVIFMDAIGKWGGNGEENLGELRIVSLLYADDVVLLALTECDTLKQAVGLLAA